MPFNLSTGEILVLLLVAVVIFGGSLPEVARKVARTVGQFRRGMNEEMRRIDVATRVEEPPAAAGERPSEPEEPAPPEKEDA